MNLYIKVGSITNAQRAISVLRSKGFKPILKRIENPSPGDGCGYALEVYSADESVIKELENAKINILGVDNL